MPTSSEANGSRSRSSSPKMVNSPGSLRRSNDELRRHIATLKRELELERTKSKQAHRDKIADIRRVRDKSSEEVRSAIELAGAKIRLESEQELMKLKDTFNRERESDMKQLLKFKEEELRVTKRVMNEEKQRDLLNLEEKHRRFITSRSLKEDITDQERKLRRELIEVRKQKQALEMSYKTKTAEETDKNDTIRRMKDEFELKQQQSAKEYKREVNRLLNEMASTQRTSDDKVQAVSKMESGIRKLEWEKETLNDQLKEQSAKLESLSADSKKEKSTERDPIHKQMKELSRKNFELGMTVRRLEEKGKELTEQVTAMKLTERKQASKVTRYEKMITTLKRSYTMERARQIAVHAKLLLDKNNHIKQLIEEKQSFTPEEYRDKDVASLEGTIQQLQRENLRLAKQLTLSPPPSVGSEDDESSNWKQEKDAIVQENNNLILKLRDAEDSSRTFVSQLSASRNEKDIIASKLTAKEDECCRLLGQYKEAESECERIKSTLTENEDIQNEMEKKLSGMQDELMDVQDTLKNKTERCLQFGSELKLIKGENVALRNKLAVFDKVDKERSQLKTDVDELKRELANKVTEITRLESSLDDFVGLQGELVTLEEHITQLEGSRKQSMSEIQSRDEELEALHNERDRQKHAYEDRLYNLQNEMSLLEARLAEQDSNRQGLLQELHELQLREVRTKQDESMHTTQPSPTTRASNSPVSPDSLSPVAPATTDSDLPLAAEYLQSSSTRPGSGGNSPASRSRTLESPTDTTEVFQHDDLQSEGNLASPKSVVIERRLSDSVVLRWQPPYNGPSDDRLKGYAVYVNGKRKQLVLGAKRTNALVSDIDLREPMTFTVRSVAVSGATSDDSNSVQLRWTEPASNVSLLEARIAPWQDDGSREDTGSASIGGVSSSLKKDEMEANKDVNTSPSTNRGQSSGIQLTASTRIEISDDLDLSVIAEETADELLSYEAKLVLSDDSIDTEASDILEFIGPTKTLSVAKTKSADIVGDDVAVRSDEEGDLIGGLPELPYDNDDQKESRPKLPLSPEQNNTPRRKSEDIEEDSIEEESKRLPTESVSSDVKVSSMSSFGFSDDSDEEGDVRMTFTDDVASPATVLLPPHSETRSTEKLHTGSRRLEIQSSEETYIASERHPRHTHVRTSEAQPNDETNITTELPVTPVYPIIKLEPPVTTIDEPSSRVALQQDDPEEEFPLEDDDAPMDGESVLPVRVFISLFAYDPITMSPNVDGRDTELDFVEGDLIKILGDVDGDGFYTGELRGRQGLVPSNMVQEVNLDIVHNSPPEHSPSHGALSDQSQSDDITYTMPDRHDVADFDVYKTQNKSMMALYDYDPNVSSPNVDAEAELAFRAGDVLAVFGEMDEDGFYAGERRGQRGLVPSNFLQECTTSSQAEIDGIEIGFQSDKQKFSSVLSTANAVQQNHASPKGKKKRGIFKSGKRFFAKLAGK